MKEQKNRLTNERDFRQDPNFVSEDKEKEALVLQLGTMITDRYLVKYTKSMKTDDPEFWALNEVLTKEEVRFLLKSGRSSVPAFSMKTEACRSIRLRMAITCRGRS